MERRAKLERKTSEVEVSVDIDLDGSGKYDIETGIPFLDHMLAQFAKHGYFDLSLRAKGDIEVDFHHTVEDIGLALGNPKTIRAVGNANGRNPIAIIIPCHRVIGSDGSLTGYAGGLWRKQWLLDYERSQVSPQLFPT